MEVELEEDKNWANQHNIKKNNPSDASGSSTSSCSMNNDDPYLILMLMQTIVACYIFWNNCLWKSYILYNNVLDILSELKNNGLPISVTITCMLTFWLLLSLCCPILYDKGTVIDI